MSAGRVRQRHGLEPAQRAELGLRVAKPVEHRHPHQGFDVDLVAGAPKDAAQFAKAQRLPQFLERPDRAQCTRRFKLDLGLRLGAPDWRPPRGLQQPVDHRIQGSADLIQAPEGGDGALADAALVIAERLDELDVAPRTGGRDLDVHATKIAGLPSISRRKSIPENVPPQGLSEKRPETRIKFPLAPSKKGPKIGFNCRTRGSRCAPVVANFSLPQPKIVPPPSGASLRHMRLFGPWRLDNPSPHGGAGTTELLGPQRLVPRKDLYQET